MCSPGHLIELTHYNRVLSIDAEAGSATVQAGITLADLNQHLDRRGVAFPNLGDIAYQTVTGATATATHGTGRLLPGLSVSHLHLGRGDSLARCIEIRIRGTRGGH